MSKTRCHRCGRDLNAGALTYEVEVKVRSMFDGVIPESESHADETEIERLIRDMAACNEEELNRQVYEDDVFIMCPECKEAFMESIYSHLHPQAAPDHGRAHLIH
ncbi:MAG: hypothetical protein RDU20_08210 [Desulfomonilaceae bacterium]|nr:hypothetical protein [Desulfomonilaceae bacterium]